MLVMQPMLGWSLPIPNRDAVCKALVGIVQGVKVSSTAASLINRAVTVMQELGIDPGVNISVSSDAKTAANVARTIGTLLGCSGLTPNVAPPPPTDTSGGRVLATRLATNVTTRTAVGKLISEYPTGSVGRYNRTRGKWAIYAPVSLAGYGLGDLGCGACNVSGLGVAPATPVGMQKIAELDALPAGVANGGEEADSWYERPIVWLGIAGGLAVIGGAWWFLRK